MSSVLRFGVYGNRESWCEYAIQTHEMAHEPCPICNLDQWHLRTMRNRSPRNVTPRNDLRLAMWRYTRRTRFYLFFELVEPERYPDRTEDGAWTTPRLMVIPIDIVGLLVCWYQSDEMTPFDEYCTNCDCEM